MVTFYWLPWPEAAEQAVTLGYLALLMLASWKDLRERRIPDWLNLCVCVCSILSVAVSATNLHAVFRHLAGALLFSLPLLITDLIRPGSFGGGDIKLAFAGGLFVSLEEAIPAMAVSFGAAAAVSAGLLLRRRVFPVKPEVWESKPSGLPPKSSGLPLGPFLALGLGLAVLLR